MELEDKEIRVLLIAKDDTSRQKYLSAMEECSVNIFVSDSFHDLTNEICSQSFHGIFLDLQTKLKAIRLNKNYVYGLVEKFPVCHLKIDNETGEMKCFYRSQVMGGTIFDFINNECMPFSPRMIRSDKRVFINLNVRIFRSRRKRGSELSTTINISNGGCFIFSTEKWRIGDDVWIQIIDLKHSQLIKGQIRNVVKWGESNRLPGIGVEFKLISPSQRDEIGKLMAF